MDPISKWIRRRRRRRTSREVREIVGQLMARQPSTRAPVYLGDRVVLAPTHFDRWIYVDTDDLSVCPHIIMTGTWEQGTTRFFQTYLREGMHYVEVGANYGYYTLQAACLVGASGTVTAFEPAPRTYALLYRTMAANGVLPRSTLRQEAVSDKAGTASFFLKGEWHGGNALHATGPDAPFEETSVEVTTSTLDDTCLEHPVDFLKMDAEGAEGLVLAGATRMLDANPQLMMIIESSPRALRRAGTDPQAFMRSLADRGLRFWIIGEDGRGIPATADGAMADRDQICDVFCAREIPPVREGFEPLIEE